MTRAARNPLTGLMGFLRGCLRTIPWLALVAGPVLCAAGSVTILSVSRFADRATEADILVLRIDERRREERSVFRPVFAATAPDGRAFEYAGELWLAPAPHAAGDIVPGRVDYTTGEIRSLRLMDGQARLGEGTLGLGIACLLLAAVYFIARMLNRDFRDARRRKGG